MTGTPATAVAPPRTPAWWRLPILVPGFVALVVGIGAGLARLGVPMPDAASAQAATHGPLMICGFFGVVIALERAVALGRAWGYAAPIAAGAGTASVLAGAPAAAAWCWVAASAVLLAASLDVLRRQRAAFVIVIAIAAGCWTWGALAWALEGTVQAALGGWLGFLVLTIAGERLELSRFMPPSRNAQRGFMGLLAVALVAIVAWRAPWAPHLYGAALLGFAAWLVRYDIARRTVRQRGLTRYIATCLLAGYAWLAIAGATMLVAGLSPGSRAYDAALHAVLLGFVISMVLGHAPIILPAVMRTALPYAPRFYAPLVLLHLSVALRVAGDAAGVYAWTRWGGMLSAIAIVAFLLNTITAIVGGRKRNGDNGRGGAARPVRPERAR